MVAVPRPASTVVLVDEQNRVYMTKRPETMKFLAGYYVFPGGSVEESDSQLDNDRIINKPNEQPFPIGHYIAAARELFEEVGILLCRNRDGSLMQLSAEKVESYRRQLNDDELSLVELLEREDLILDLSHLTYFGCKITPPSERYRFDTRFFFARLPEGQTPKNSLREVAEALWISTEDALTAYRNEAMLLAPPTVHSLATIEQHLNGNPVEMPSNYDSAPLTPEHVKLMERLLSTKE